MKTIKVLNLYACLGGNRYKWDEVAKKANIELEVTAVELDPELARLYQERFPKDKVIIADAHQFLLDHYQKFDFIWSSPPCPTHSKARYWGSKGEQSKIKIARNLVDYEAGRTIFETAMGIIRKQDEKQLEIFD